MLLFSQTVSKKTYLVSTSTSKVDLYDGLNHTLVLNKDNFDISYQPWYSGSNDKIRAKISNLDLYFSMYFQRKYYSGYDTDTASIFPALPC